jgi:hypothetical protein
MHSEVGTLAVMLEEAAALLRCHKFSHWADWLAKDAMLIRKLDFYGVEHLLSAFGGMGSLNDVGLAQPSPASPSILVASTEDARFQSLLREIHALATRLSREQLRVSGRT